MKTVFYISNVNTVPLSISGLQKPLNFTVKQLASIYDILPMISNSNLSMDLVIIDLQNVHDQLHEKTIEIVSTISTLMNNTLYRDQSGSTKLRKVLLVAALEETCDHELVKDTEIMLIDGIYPEGPSFTLDEKESVLIGMFEGKKVVPPFFKKIIRPTKKQRVVNNDEIVLTPRQQQIVKLMCDRGASNKVIAKMLNISVSTVKLHVTALLKKYKVKNRTQLVLFATQSQKKNNTVV
jgi:DNA-binding NarL/FixJ family response regulator